MRRFFNLYTKYVAMSIKSTLSYKIDSIIGLAAFFITNGVTFLTLNLIIGNLSQFGESFTFAQVGILYGLILIPKGIDHMFSDNLWMVGVSWVQYGKLDQYMTKPISPLFQIIASKFMWDGIGEIILGTIFVIIFIPEQNIDWNFIYILFLVVCELLGVILFYAIKLITCSLAFWMKRSIFVMNMVYSLSDYAKYPIHLMGNVVKTILLFVVPFGTVFFLPFYCLYAKEYPAALVFSFVFSITLLFLFLGLLLWNRGLKRYESSGS